MTPIILNLIGPTACGKTDIAIAIAKQLQVTIISVDSALIYRKMDIGTAKPNHLLQQQIPHHLIDICEPEETYSAGNFAKDASKLIANIQQEQQIPLLVGGTMLYFKALYQGLANLPKADLTIRHYISQLATRFDWQHCHQILQQVDPESARQIHPNDPQRIQRALEVYYISGKPLSDYWQNTHSLLPANAQYLTIGLYPKERSILHQQIAKRFDTMLANGFLDEVHALMQRPGLHADLPSMRAVGYRQAWQYLAGKIDYATMRETAIIATRQLAKRQMTWLKSWPNVDYWYDPFVDEDIANKIIERQLRLPTRQR